MSYSSSVRQVPNTAPFHVSAPFTPQPYRSWTKTQVDTVYHPRTDLKSVPGMELGPCEKAVACCCGCWGDDEAQKALFCKNEENSTWTCGRVVTLINFSVSLGMMITASQLSGMPGAQMALTGIGLGSMGLNLLIPTVRAIWISNHPPAENDALLPV